MICTIPSLSYSRNDIKQKTNMFVGLTIENGIILPTNDYVKEDLKSKKLISISAKCGFQSTAKDKLNISFGMPYWGGGINICDFYCGDLGYPTTLFIFQGGTLKNISEKWKFNYEWNLGISRNWNKYDPISNPDNIAIGANTNAYVAYISYLNWKISQNNNIKMGLKLSHFSNGSTKKPNKGLNLSSSFLEWDYVFSNNTPLTKTSKESIYNKTPHWDYDFSTSVSTKEIYYDTLNTGLKSKYLDRKYKIIAVSFAPLYVPSFRYKYGLNFDLLYDESCNIKVSREYNYTNSLMSNKVELGSIPSRFSFGISAKGEIAMPHYSIFANYGYTLWNRDNYDSQFYQILGVKLYLSKNIFSTFGIRATHFTSAHSLQWGLGYTLK